MGEQLLLWCEVAYCYRCHTVGMLRCSVGIGQRIVLTVIADEQPA